jgi:hypothetical protein
VKEGIKGVRMVVTGGILLVVALAVIPRLRKYDYECNSVFGRLAQQYGGHHFDLKCTTVDVLVQMRDWMLGAGILSLVGGAFLIIASVFAAAQESGRP